MNKKFFIGTAVLIAILISAVFVFYQNNESNNYISANNYCSLSEFYYDGDFKEFNRDVYNWYKNVENENGIYIVNTSYYDSDILNIWRENKIYNSIPDKPFWYYTVSPSYLKQMNISIDDKEITDAENGIRLYLIPDTMTADEIEMTEKYLQEDAIKNALESDIQTAFTENPQVRIIKYTPNGEYFTFPSNKGEDITTDAPVIYVCTCENMKNFENESLIATGIDSYVKFENMNAAEKLINNEIKRKYSLKYNTLSDIYKKAAKAKLVDKNVYKVFAE